MARRKQVRRPGEGTVYQRKDGRFVFEVTLEDHSRKPCYFKTEKEALDKQLEVRMQIAQGTLATGPQQTVKQFLEYWLEDVHKPPLVSLRTYVNCKVVVYKHLIPGLGYIKLQKLTTQDIQSFYMKKLKGGTTVSRIGSLQSVFHAALEHARRVKLVSTNVSSDVQLPKQEDVEIQPLTPEQAKVLLQKMKEHQLEGVVTLALATGMREGELLSLRWSDVNFDAGKLQVARTVQYISGRGFVEKEPKTAKSKRKIMLPSFVIEALKRHRVTQLEKRLAAGAAWVDRDLVFPNNDGDFVHCSTLLRRFRRLLLASGLPRIRFHDVRRFGDCKIALKGQKVRANTF